MTNLPLDIVLQILSFVDNYTVVAFLNAYPQWKPLALVLTDHDTPAMFFEIEGVSRLYLRNAAQEKYIDECGYTDVYDPLVHTHPIRLIELAYMESTECLVEEYACHIPTGKSCPMLNSTSFLFIRAGLERGTYLEEVSERLDQYTMAKWHFGLPVYFSENGDISNRIDYVGTMMEYVGSPVRRGPIVNASCPWFDLDLSFLKTLRIENASRIRELKLPQLRELSVIFHPELDSTPELSSIIAPELRLLVIHFYRQMPVLSDLRIPHTHMTAEEYIANRYQETVDEQEDLDDARRFELSRVSALQSGRQCNDTVSESEESQFMDALACSDFSFLKAFHVVHLYGVSYRMLLFFDLSRAEFFRWKVTWRSHIAPGSLPSSPWKTQLRLLMSTIEVNCRGFTVPKWSGAFKSLLVYDWDCDARGLWTFPEGDSDTGMLRTHCSLFIYQSVSMLRSDPNARVKSMISLTPGDWFNISFSLSEVCSLNLVGVRMPFLVHVERWLHQLLLADIPEHSFCVIVKPALERSQEENPEIVGHDCDLPCVWAEPSVYEKRDRVKCLVRAVRIHDVKRTRR